MTQEQQLFEYLKRKLNEIPNYEEDVVNYRKCKVLDLCSCKRKEN